MDRTKDTVFDNYDLSKPIATINFIDRPSDEVLSGCFIAPMMRQPLEEGDEVVAWGLFPKASIRKD